MFNFTNTGGAGGFNTTPNQQSNAFQTNSLTTTTGGFGINTGGFGSGAFGSNMGSSFNQQQQQQQAMMQQYNQGPTTNDDRKYDEYLSSLQTLLTSYTQKVSSGQMTIGTPSVKLNDACSFRSLIYTEAKRSSGALVAFPSRPMQTSSETWKACVNRLVEHDLTDQLHPEVCVGAETLANYTESINNKANELKEMISVSNQISRKRNGVTLVSKERMEKIRNKHEKLTLKLLDVMIKLHVVQNMEIPLQSAERDLYQKISHLQDKTRMSTTMVHDLRAEIAANNGGNTIYNNGVGGYGGSKMQELDQTELNVLKQSLLQQRYGLDKLCSVLNKDYRDIQIMKN